MEIAYRAPKRRFLWNHERNLCIRFAENPLHNRERHPVKRERQIERVWKPMPDEMYERLRLAGRRYRRYSTAANRIALSALIYEAFMAGCSPLSVSAAADTGREQARRYAEAHRERNPGLPPTPSLHGNGVARRRDAS